MRAELISCSAGRVRRQLSTWTLRKSQGPDEVLLTMLQRCADQPAHPPCELFKPSMLALQVPGKWTAYAVFMRL